MRAPFVLLAALAAHCGTAIDVPPDASDDAIAPADDGNALPVDSPAPRDGSPDAPRDVASDAPRDAPLDGGVPPRDVPSADRGAPFDVPVARDVPVATDTPVANDNPVTDVPDVPPPPPDFDAIPWSYVGVGVAYRDTQDTASRHVFIGYAGYGVQADWARAWVSRLYRDTLRGYGVRHVYAVQGPADVSYSGREIGNSRLIAHLLQRLDPTARVVVAAHSSGTYVAHELLGQLYERGLDPSRTTAQRLAYYNLDGGSAGFTRPIFNNLRRSRFVWAIDPASGTRGPNTSSMLSLGTTYPSATGGTQRYDALNSGCNRGAVWCVHMAVINARPHNPASGNAQADYSSFDIDHPVSTGWLLPDSFATP